MCKPLTSASYSTTLLEAEKWIQIIYLMRTPREEMMMSPTLDPLFISDPSKYIVQYSYSTGASGVWVSIHSATKSASS
jgi:hypothetical protein